jgi:glycosyltransferase involved in cell wall biosynthesis
MTRRHARRSAIEGLTAREVLARKRGFLFVIPWELDLPGGVNQVVSNLFEEMKVGGSLRPLLLVMSWAHRRVQEATTPTGPTPVFRLRLRSPNPGWKALLAFSCFLPFTLRSLRRLLREQGVAVVNVHYPGLGALHFAILRSLRLFKGTLTLSFHGADLRELRDSRGLQRLGWGLLLQSADVIVTCSESLRAQLVDTAPALAKRVVAIHNGLDLDRFLGERDPAFTVDEAKLPATYVLSIASFEHKKGLDVLLRAFREVQRQRDVGLVMIGGGRPYRATLDALAVELGIGDRVQMIEDLPHSRVHAYLERAAVFVLASRDEPFGLVLLEAGAYALAVVATAVGGIPEVIRHGETGRLVQAENVTRLAGEIGRLLDRPEERHRLGSALKEEIRRRFSWTDACQAYITLAVR